MSVQDKDRGWRNIKRELGKAQKLEVAIGVLEGSKNDKGLSIAEYAAVNEYGGGDVPARPFMAISFDENLTRINRDFIQQGEKMVHGQATAQHALTVIGQKHADRIYRTITGRDILPRLAPSTVSAKKGSTKTLVDHGALANAVHSSVRGRT